jgi:hypothetical protein
MSRKPVGGEAREQIASTALCGFLQVLLRTEVPPWAVRSRAVGLAGEPRTGPSHLGERTEGPAHEPSVDHRRPWA